MQRLDRIAQDQLAEQVVDIRLAPAVRRIGFDHPEQQFRRAVGDFKQRQLVGTELRVKDFADRYRVVECRRR